MSPSEMEKLVPSSLALSLSRLLIAVVGAVVLLLVAPPAQAATDVLHLRDARNDAPKKVDILVLRGVGTPKVLKFRLRARGVPKTGTLALTGGYSVGDDGEGIEWTITKKRHGMSASYTAWHEDTSRSGGCPRATVKWSRKRHLITGSIPVLDCGSQEGADSFLSGARLQNGAGVDRVGYTLS